MKTTKNTFLKVLGMVALTLTLVSCGKDNNSGGNNYGNYGGVNIAGLGSGSQIVEEVMRNNPCREGNRQRTTRTYQMYSNGQNVPLAIGATGMGDVAVLVSNGQTAQLTVYACNQISGQPTQVQFLSGVAAKGNQCGYFELTAYIATDRPGYQQGAFVGSRATVSCPNAYPAYGNGSWNNQIPNYPYGQGWY